ncbi:MAG: gamma carbonic anhydrase family protein [Candidatus Thermoplasmatota archaeon]|jgi:carbonic anhydrase/acetyltransferase-like protein (isoleucine patch superfamily)|nr:gamma carbonic anhydrase family protein [Candidatus Thermoplasmatota archaeon]MCL5988185.1 gamma carbonic anhydrase family protein [Candidatus Thermoplasmatota archaeon]
MSLTTGIKCYISPLSSIRGNVQLGEECSIFDFASIRAEFDEIFIDSYSNIQDNVSLHVDEGFPIKIGKYVSVGHNAVVHGATIQDDCIIGMGAILMNGSRIGEGSIIAAGAVVLQNAEIPAYSMVSGVPGKVRKTDPLYKQMGHANALEYLKIKEIYRK